MSFAMTAASDLMLFDRWATGSKSTEIHVLTKASNYQTFSSHLPTCLSESNANSSFFIDSSLNLYLILQNDTGSQTTEVHKFPSSSGYRTPTLQNATALAEVNNNYLQAGPGQAVLFSGPSETGSTWLVENSINNLELLLNVQQPINSIVPGAGVGVYTYPQVNYGGASTSYYEKANTDTAPAESIELWQQYTDAQADLTYSSLMTEDYQYNAQSQLAKVNTFQTILTFGHAVTTVTIFAEKQVTITVDGVTHTIDNVASAQFTLPATGKLIISAPAAKLGSPAYRVQTNLMAANAFTMVFPDSHLHHKIASLPAGNLQANRAQMSLAGTVTASDCDQVQNAMSNVAKAVTYPPGDNPTANALNQESMSHDHWKLSFGSGSASYTPLTTVESAKVLAGSQPYTGSGATSFFGDIGHFFSSAASDVGHGIEDAATFVAHTVVATADEVINAPEQMYNAAKTAAQDLAKGDFTGALGAVGGEAMNLGKLSSGPIGAVAANMAAGEVKKVVLATVQLGEQSVSFVIDHTGVVGDVIGFMIKKIGGAIEDAIHWLLEQFGWDHVTRIQGVLKGGLNSMISDAASKIQTLNMNTLATDLKTTISSGISGLESELGTNGYFPNSKSNATAMHRLDWIADKLKGGTSAGNPTSNSPFATFENTIINSVGTTFEEILTNIEDGIKGVETSPQKAPELLISTILNVVEDIVDEGITIVQDTVNFAEDNAQTVFNDFSTIITQDIEIPFMSDLFTLVTEEKLTFENLGTLVSAIPLAIFDKNIFSNQSLALSASNHLDDCKKAVAVLQAVSGVLNAIGDGMSVTATAGAAPTEPMKIISTLQVVTDVLSKANTGALAYGGTSTSAKVLWPVSGIAVLMDLAKMSDNLINTRYAENRVWKIAGMVTNVIAKAQYIYNAIEKPSIQTNLFGTISAGKPLLRNLLMTKPTTVQIIALCSADIVVGGGLCAMGYANADKS